MRKAALKKTAFCKNNEVTETSNIYPILYTFIKKRWQM